MLDINYKNIVEDAIKKNIKYYEPFTSLDISNQCKQINPYLRHKDVSQFVHEYMNKCFENNTTNYISTTINVNNNLNRTTLYHPKWESNLFLAYDEDRRNLKPIPTKRDPLSIPIVHSLILKEIDRFGLIGAHDADIRYSLSLNHGIYPKETQESIEDLIASNKIQLKDGRLYLSTIKIPVTTVKSNKDIKVSSNSPKSGMDFLPENLRNLIKMFHQRQ